MSAIAIRSGSFAARRDQGQVKNPSPDDRLALLIDLKLLEQAMLKCMSDHRNLGLFPDPLLARFAAREDEVETCLSELNQLGGSITEKDELVPEVCLKAGFATVGRQAGIKAFDHADGRPSLLTGALFINSLCVVVVSAFLNEDDSGKWRSVLLSIFGCDRKFEGLLRDELSRCNRTIDHDAEKLLGLVLALQSPGFWTERLWSFDLLRMSIRRMLCGGSVRIRGGFFPLGMSGAS